MNLYIQPYASQKYEKNIKPNLWFHHLWFHQIHIMGLLLKVTSLHFLHQDKILFPTPCVWEFSHWAGMLVLLLLSSDLLSRYCIYSDLIFQHTCLFSFFILSKSTKHSNTLQKMCEHKDFPFTVLKNHGNTFLLMQQHQATIVCVPTSS